MEAALESNAELFQRGVGRRKEDRLIRDLLNVGQVITSEMNMDVLFKTIIEETNHIMDTERCTMFVYDSKSDELWSFNSSDPKRKEVHIPPTRGAVGGFLLTKSLFS
jgi:adenylate cyclase